LTLQVFLVRRLNFLLTLLLALSVAALVESCGSSMSTSSPDPSSQIKISTSSLPTGQLGTGYSTTLTATGGAPPYTWSLTSGTLPAGLTLNASTGAITGTPSAAVASTPLTFKVTDSGNPALTQSAALTLTVSPGSLVISTSSLPNGQTGAAYSSTLAATGGVSPYTWSLTSGTLPAGLTLDASTGAITGTPSAAVASTPLTFKVTDSSSPALTQTANLTLTVSPVSLVISTSSLPNGQTGAAYSATLAAAGGVSPYTWSLTRGSLPAGLNLNASTGVITGTPSAAVASTALTFKVSDSSSPALTQTANLTLTISSTPTVASVTLNPTSVIGGTSLQGTVTLSGPALNGGATVTLTSSNTAAAQVPASVVVAAAASSATFTVTTSSVSSSTSSVISASYNSSTQTATLAVTPAAPSVSVLTYHNDNLRTGQNLKETILTTANVNSTKFGKLFSLPVDGPIFAQPLYMPGVVVGTQTHNLVFVATEHNSVYAWDADTGSSNPVWTVSFNNPAGGVTAIPCAEVAGNLGNDCSTITPEFGITSTPAIDSSTGTLYVVASTKEVSGGTTSYVYRLHALNISTGQEKFGGPVVLQATASSTAGTVTFVPIKHLQRPGLLLVNGVVYIGFGSHGDVSPWYGWLLGYSASTLKQVLAFNASPNAGDSGIWQSGAGPASDASGNIYFNTGNGGFDVNTGGIDYGDSIVKLNSSGTVLDYFTPYNQATLDATDADLGASGLVLLPDQTGTYAHVLVSASKQGVIYSVNRDGMSKYHSGGNQNIQSLAGLSSYGLFGSPAYWNGNVYFAAWNDYLRAFQVSNGTLALTSHSSVTLAFPGATPSVSSNGTSNGIVWIIQENVPNDTVINNPPTAVLRSYDATNLANELYDSTQAAGNRDAAGGAVKFAVPTVANGKVYVGNSNQLTVYGLLP
jgi:Putative Ig domain